MNTRKEELKEALVWYLHGYHFWNRILKRTKDLTQEEIKFAKRNLERNEFGVKQVRKSIIKELGLIKEEDKDEFTI